MDNNAFFCAMFGFLVLLAFLLIRPLLFSRRGPSSSGRRYKAVQGYIIHDERGRESVVPLDIASKRTRTGKYTFVGAATVDDGPAAGGCFVNDGAGGELWLPPGHVVNEEFDNERGKR